MIKGLVKRFQKNKHSTKNTLKPTIVPRAEHAISRNDISSHVLKVLYRLHKSGYSAYLVGGCVRDLLLNRHPKDFDVATNAHPDEVRKLFRNCRLIGKRFRLAHIVFGKDIVEVATFRTHHENAHEHLGKTHQGMIVRDNVYGTIEDDVSRRDFTINALYYNIADFSIVDYMQGMQDIQTRTLRMIGDPTARFQEDPVRMIRAMRFMGKLNLNISPETEAPIFELSHLLGKVSSARLFLEVMKLLQEGALLPTFHLLRKYQLFAELFPAAHLSLDDRYTITLIETALGDADNRVQQNKTVSPAFIFAIFLWPSVLQHLKMIEHLKLPIYVASEKAIQHAAKEQTERLAIPRNLLIIIREICTLQFRFHQRYSTRPFRMLTHPRFRAAYDLLLLRTHAGEKETQEISEWWTTFYNATETQREAMVKEIEKANAKKRNKKKTVKKTAPAPTDDIK